MSMSNLKSTHCNKDHKEDNAADRGWACRLEVRRVHVTHEETIGGIVCCEIQDMIPCVFYPGSYMTLKRQKLLDQFNENVKPNGNESAGIFHGVVIYVNGYTDPSADILRSHMAKYGGQYSTYLTKDVTHVVATNLCWTKIDKLNDRSPKIVHPQWITDCIKESKLLPDVSYLLYQKPADTHSILKFVDQPKKTNEIHSPTKSIEIGSETVKTAKDPNFIDDFYARSRLHMISTWCQEMKQLVKKWQANSSAAFEGRKLISEHDRCLPSTSMAISSPCVMHLDMDCFFVSVGLLKHPELKGLPVAITHSKGKGPTNRTVSDKFHSYAEIASCSYEARRRGIKNGMFLGDALALCPELKTLTYDFEDYKRVSQLFYETVARIYDSAEINHGIYGPLNIIHLTRHFTLDIEAVSCDEMFVNMKNVIIETNSDPLTIASVIRKSILEATKCTSSAGLGCNKLIARLATRKAKPNGQYILRDAEVSTFMDSINVLDLPGVGHSLAEKLDHLNVQNCKELKRLSISTLKKEFGSKTGEKLYNFARGIDNRTLPEASSIYNPSANAGRKSVSCDVNYGIRFSQIEDVQDFLKKLACELSKRLQTGCSKGKVVTLKCLIRAKDAPVETKKFLGTGIVDSFTRSSSLHDYTDDQDVIYRECIKLFRSVDQIIISDLRGLGISMHKLSSTSVNVSCAVASKDTLSKFITKDAAEETSDDQIKILHEMPASSTAVRSKVKMKEVNKTKSHHADDVPMVEEEPSFFGLVNLEELKPALSQWIIQCDVPNEEDCNLCVDFLLQLIHRHRMTTCYELMKYIFEQISSLKRPHNQWIDFYRASTELVQDLVKNKYCHPLRLPSFDN